MRIPTWIIGVLATWVAVVAIAGVPNDPNQVQPL
jgi:hypothetical protein